MDQTMEQGEGYPAVLETVEKSTDEIFDLRNESNEMVMNVQIANDMRELNRREADFKSKIARTEFLEEKARQAEAQLDEINSKWDMIAKFNDAIDIYNACEMQKDKYTEVFECKNKIIETLKKELSKADEKFVNDQKLQKEDISILSSRINNQLEIMKNAYRRHLNLIEQTINNERKLLLYRKHQEWINLNESYARQQNEALEETFSTVEEYEKSISVMVSEHYEKYRAAKKKLDFEVQALHIELEKVKSTCLLNERKLEYNYLVLSKRHEELGKIKAAQRRRINKLRDVLIEIQNKKKECEKTHSCEVVKFEKCVEDLKQNVEAVNEKMVRTDDTNENTYRKIWKFNEKRVRLFLEKIYNFDRFIHEKQLRNKWDAPPMHTMRITELPSVQFALKHLPNFQLSDGDDSSESKNHSKPNQLEDLPLLKFILLNIAESIEFLISDKLELLTEGLSDEKKSLVRFDNTLKLLKVHNENDLNLLRNHFAPHVECLTCKKDAEGSSKEVPGIQSHYYKSLAANKRTGSGNLLTRKSRFTNLPLSARAGSKTKFDTPEVRKICENPQHSWFIDQLSVIKLLTDFIREMKSRERKKLMDQPLQKILLSRILSSKDVVLFWTQFRSNFVEERNALWEAMIPCVSKYQSLLQENTNVEAEVQRLSKQNSELKKALKNFTVRMR